MKGSMVLSGIALVVVGILMLAYQGFTYTQPERVAQIGDVKITADTKRGVYFPPILGGALIIAGIGFVALSKK